jgi:hypothetical protein
MMTLKLIRNSNKHPLLWEKSETTPSDFGNQTSLATPSAIKADEKRPNGTLEQQSNDSESINQSKQIQLPTFTQKNRYLLKICFSMMVLIGWSSSS